MNTDNLDFIVGVTIGSIIGASLTAEYYIGNQDDDDGPLYADENVVIDSTD